MSDIEIQADEILRNRSLLNDILAKHTGKSVDDIARDTDRDFFLSAEQAKEYGLVDNITERPDADEDVGARRAGCERPVLVRQTADAAADHRSDE